MAVKSSAGVTVNREVVEAIWGLCATTNSALDNAIPQIKSSCQYLASEDNVGGSVAENFRQGNKQIEAFLNDMASKTTVVSNTMANLANALQLSFNAAVKNSEDARNQLNAVLQKQKSIGQ